MDIAKYTKIIAILSAVLATLYFGTDILQMFPSSSNESPPPTSTITIINNTTIIYQTVIIYNMFSTGDGKFYIITVNKDIIQVDEDTYQNAMIGKKIDVRET